MKFKWSAKKANGGLFVCFVRADKNCTDLNSDDYDFLGQHFKLGENPVENVWLISEENVEDAKKTLTSPDFIEDTVGGNGTAKGVLDYMAEEGILKTAADFDDEDEGYDFDDNGRPSWEALPERDRSNETF